MTGKVIDSYGRQSHQIDLVVHDTFYSPLLFTLGDATSYGSAARIGDI